MKIVKRDGRIVEYDSDKIRIAIGKANAEVDEDQRISKTDIENIIKYIENLKKKRMLVEDIQDIIEEKIMNLGRFELAKHYIIYRYTRTLVRKANTTDETILSLIKNSNGNLVTNGQNRNLQMASTQRDLIAGEVSKDLTKRMLLPEKISKAHEDAVIYFHDTDYFLHPVIDSCLINIEDMLDNGTVMNEKFIESPKGFQVACTVMTQIIALVASGQYGGQSVEMKHLGKYLRKSYDKFKSNLQTKYTNLISEDKIEEMVQDRLKEELVAGVQTIQYQINTLMTTSGKPPFVTLFLSLEDDDPYIEENAKIIEEILNQRMKGIKDKNGEYVTIEFPKLVYALGDNNCLDGGKYDYLTELAINCSLKHGYPDYISTKKMKENYNGNVFSIIGNRQTLPLWKDDKRQYKFAGRFNQGTVSLNLPQIAIIADKNEEVFWKLLDERLDLCFEALMCIHHSLLGTNSDISPIHWQYGAIARLESGEKIDKYLKDKYSTLTLGYIGIYETTKLMRGISHVDGEGKKFAITLLKKLKAACTKWKNDTGLGFELCATLADKIGYELVNKDKERFGNIKNITDKTSYMDSYHIKDKTDIKTIEKLTIESEYEKISSGGSVSYVKTNSIEELKEIIKFSYDNIQYLKLDKNINRE